MMEEYLASLKPGDLVYYAAQVQFRPAVMWCYERDHTGSVQTTRYEGVEFAPGWTGGVPKTTGRVVVGFSATGVRAV